MHGFITVECKQSFQIELSYFIYYRCGRVVILVEIFGHELCVNDKKEISVVLKCLNAHSVSGFHSCRHSEGISQHLPIVATVNNQLESKFKRKCLFWTYETVWAVRHTEFVNDDSPPFLFILPPLLSLSVQPSPYLYWSVPLSDFWTFPLWNCFSAMTPFYLVILETWITATLQML